MTFFYGVMFDGVMMRSWLRAVVWLALGLALGVALGLYVGWVAWPLEVTEANPTILQEQYRQDYTLLIAAAYGEDGDLEAARQRLYSLNPDDPAGWLVKFTVDYILAGRDETEIRQLVRLANDLGLYSPAMAPYLPALETDDVQE